MKANAFYQKAEGKAIPLIFINTEKLQAVKTTEAENNHFKNQQFNAKKDEVCLVTNADGELIKVYLGYEKNDKAGALANAALKCPPAVYTTESELTEKELIQWGLAQYRYDRYKKNKTEGRVLFLAAQDMPSVTAWVDALFFVRDLINHPTSDLGPEEMAEAVQTLASEHGAAFHQWIDEELLKDNYPAIHAVGRAAVSGPRLLSLTWGDDKHPLVSLVGKGVCFDTGGLDLKPASAMRLMKKDMGGAAQVLGLAKYIMTQKLPLRLQVYIPAVENAIGPDAFRPGDVLTMRNGLTVEVDNTDAEGRLVLADALVKASEGKPEVIIDFATLTGAARVAVGTDISAMFCNDEQLASDLADASESTNDPLWRLPLFEAYESMLKSKIADLANCSDTPYAGAITAALFLKHFVAEDIPWVHFDVMAWNLNARPGKPAGGEAMGIRAVAEYLTKRFAS